MTQDVDCTPTPVRTPAEFYIGPIEAAGFLGWAIQTTLLFAALGIIPAHRLRHERQTAWRFKLSELEKWSMQNHYAASPKGPAQLESTELGECLADASHRPAKARF